MNASFRNCSFNELVNAVRHIQIVTSALSINWKLVHICELVGTYAYIQLIEVLKVLVMFLQCKGSVGFLCVRGAQRILLVQTALMRHKLGYTQTMNTLLLVAFFGFILFAKGMYTFPIYSTNLYSYIRIFII